MKKRRKQGEICGSLCAPGSARDPQRACRKNLRRRDEILSQPNPWCHAICFKMSFSRKRQTWHRFISLRMVTASTTSMTRRKTSRKPMVLRSCTAFPCEPRAPRTATCTLDASCLVHESILQCSHIGVWCKCFAKPQNCMFGGDFAGNRPRKQKTGRKRPRLLENGRKLGQIDEKNTRNPKKALPGRETAPGSSFSRFWVKMRTIAQRARKISPKHLPKNAKIRKQNATI